MNDYLESALKIVEAQAMIRVLSEDEMASMLRKVSEAIRHADEQADAPQIPVPAVLPAKSIKEKSVTCLECGQSFKILSSRHLAGHNLTPERYREKWGLKPGTALVTKELQRMRKKTMKDMRLWERRSAEHAKPAAAKAAGKADVKIRKSKENTQEHHE